MLLLDVLLIGIFVVKHVSTAVYYVDNKHGSDGNDGKSLHEPFLTIQACVDALSAPGDECRVRYVMWNRMLKRLKPSHCVIKHMPFIKQSLQHTLFECLRSSTLNSVRFLAVINRCITGWVSCNTCSGKLIL